MTVSARSSLAELQADWPAIERLLDEALDRPAAERAGWLAALPEEQRHLGERVARLLAARAGDDDDRFLGELPALPTAASAAAAAGDGPALAAQPGAEVGPWRLLRELGEGGMGSVWLAERSDGSLKRQVALKLPRLGWARGLAERMARERDILATLEHPHIARLYDAGVDAHGRPWLALEHVQGRPIDEHVQSRGLDVRQRVQLLVDVCDAVAYAHSRLVIHRDLKPSNILVTDDGQVKLLDFGIAKVMQADGADDTALTALAGRALTLDYASPEQLRGEPLSTASDVYSLGVVAYELLAGQRPYRLPRGLAADVADALERTEVPPASRVATGPARREALAGGLDAILGLALRKAATERYPTVAALQQDLQRHLAGESLLARPEHGWQRLRRLLWRRRWAVGAAAAAGLTLLGGLHAQLAVMLALGAGAVLAMVQRRQALQQRDLARDERERAAQAAERARDEAARAQRAQERADAVADFLADLLGRARADTPITVGELLEQAETLARIDSASPAQRAAVMVALADLHSSLGAMKHAGELMTAAEELARRSGDAELLGLVHALQASLVARMSDPAGGQATLERLAEQHAAQPTVAYRAATALAYLAQNRNDAAAAVAWAERAQRLAMAASHPSVRTIAHTLSNLAYGKSLAGESDEALALYESSMQRYAEAQAQESAEAITVLNNWGLAELSSGHPQRALERFERAVAVARRRSPDQHLPFYLVANRGRVLNLLHRQDEALAAALEAVEAARNSGSAPAELAALSLHADALRRHGERAAARAMVDGAARGFEGRVPPTGPPALNLLRLTAALDLDDGRPEAALATLERAVAAMEAQGLQGVALALSKGVRGEVLLRLGQTGRARDDLSAALALHRKAQGRRASSADTGVALRRWGELAAAEGRPQDALAAWREAEPHLAETLGPEHPEVARLQQLLGRPG